LKIPGCIGEEYNHDQLMIDQRLWSAEAEQYFELIVSQVKLDIANLTQAILARVIY